MGTIVRLFFLFTLPFLWGSCDEQQTTAQKDTTISPGQADNLKIGGVYVIQNTDCTYYLTKILAIDGFAVHLRTYSDTFKTKPDTINSKNLKIMIGHAPVDKSGFLIGKPALLKIEEVKDFELEGYKMYLEAMSK